MAEPSNKTTSTLNPLHFEDLEPKRFEDLIRQLAYDYRDWHDLEATGRSGNDGNFDARGVERGPVAEDEDQPNLRNWQIQCKREAKIGPAKALKYAQEIAATPNLYGALFVTSAELSRNARDVMREEIAKSNIQEFHIWSRSEIEDQLFQPKNDHLLFAYFGKSLTKQQRGRAMTIKSQLATKRSAIKILGVINENHHKEILLRSSTSDNYPDHAFRPPKAAVGPNREFIDCFFIQHFYGGIVVAFKQLYMIIDNEKKLYDLEERINMLDMYDSEFTPRRQSIPTIQQNFPYFWGDVDESKRFIAYEIGVVPYHSIAAIDESGDEYAAKPHVYVQPSATGEIYVPQKRLMIYRVGGYSNNQYLFANEEYKRSALFPKRYRRPPVPKDAPQRNYVDPDEEVSFPGAKR